MGFLLSELTGGGPHSVRFSLSPGPQLYKVSRLLQPQADLIPSLAPDLGIAYVTTCLLFSSLPFPSLPPLSPPRSSRYPPPFSTVRFTSLSLRTVTWHLQSVEAEDVHTV